MCEWSRDRNWHRRVLNGSLAVHEEEQLVFNDRAAKAAAVLAALKRSENPGGVGNAAEIELSRNWPKASPWKALVPDLVVTFTAPEEVSSVDMSKLD